MTAPYEQPEGDPTPDAVGETSTPEAADTDPGPGIDPDELETTLRVLGSLHELPKGHPDIETVKRAAGRMYKAVRKARRLEARKAERQPLLEADQRLIERTATGSPQRIDDETAGILLETPTGLAGAGHVIGELSIPRGCYICHEKFTSVDSFYHWLCPTCAAKSHGKRDQHVDLRGKRALLTGGRAKIGMYIALMLLRDGAELTITTRFPRDAARRFAAQPDHEEWIDRLSIVGIDLRDPSQVVALARDVAAGGPLDILINNACQTVRRSPGAYSHLVEGEQEELTGDALRPRMLSFDRISEAHPAALVGSLGGAVPHAGAEADGGGGGATSTAAPVGDEVPLAQRTAADLTRLALQAGSASLEAHQTGTALDAGGLLPDIATQNSWTQKVQEVDPMELLEVQLCNSVAPFLLVSNLRPALAEAVRRGARRSYVVNVSAMEGQFSRRYKGAGHPHTNMAKAALNMLTRTSAEEMLKTDGILMTAVDTGWITDERPHTEKLRIAAEGWHAPLDLVDGAARVYDPIVRGEAGEDLYGVFLKDFEPHPW